jgi:hypothetical protein
MNALRDIRTTSAFDEFYDSLSDKVKDKYKYVLQIVKTQYVVSEKFIKRLENTDFYEMRISVSSNEYRTVIFAIDADNFMQSTKILLLNSFLKKGTKQYKAELEKAEKVFKEWRKEYVESE